MIVAYIIIPWWFLCSFTLIICVIYSSLGSLSQPHLPPICSAVSHLSNKQIHAVLLGSLPEAHLPLTQSFWFLPLFLDLNEGSQQRLGLTFADQAMPPSSARSWVPTGGASSNSRVALCGQTLGLSFPWSDGHGFWIACSSFSSLLPG